MRYLDSKKAHFHYLLLVLLFAWSEEFITQIIAPIGFVHSGDDTTLIAGIAGIMWVFTLYGLLALGIGHLTHRWIRSDAEPIVFYLVLGLIGALFEIFVLGGGVGITGGAWFLFPFGLVIHMSWYGTAIMASRLLLHPGPETVALRKKFLKTFVILLALAYIAIIAATIASVTIRTRTAETVLQIVIPVAIIWAFVPLNYFYWAYSRIVVGKDIEKVIGGVPRDLIKHVDLALSHRRIRIRRRWIITLTGIMTFFAIVEVFSRLDVHLLFWLALILALARVLFITARITGSTLPAQVKRTRRLNLLATILLPVCMLMTAGVYAGYSGWLIVSTFCMFAILPLLRTLRRSLVALEGTEFDDLAETAREQIAVPEK